MSLPPSTLTFVTSMVTPAPRPAAESAPISKPSSVSAEQRVVKPLSVMTLAITSTIGWARPSGMFLRR